MEDGLLWSLSKSSKAESLDPLFEHENYVDKIQHKIPVANCTPFALFPKGNSGTTIDKPGVISWKCFVNDTTCYYIEPKGYLGPSLSCE